MNQKTYFTVVSVIFSLIAILHLMRIASGWEAEIGGWMVPMWLSWAVLILAGFLAYQGLKFSRK